MKRKLASSFAGAAAALALLFVHLTPVSIAHAAPGAHGPDGEHLDSAAGTGNASALGRLPDGSVNVPKTAQRRLAIRTVIAPLAKTALTIDLPGRVVVDPNASGRVQPVHGGRIQPGPKGLPVAGQTVKRGEVLAWVQHHAEPFAVGQQQAQLAELRTQRDLAEQRLKRLESLEGTVPRKEIDAARAEAAGLLERQRRIGASLGAREALVAPVSGVIARADALAGQVVDARDVLFEIVDPSRLQVEATTSDATLAVRLGPARLQDVPGATLELRGAARALRDGVLPLTFALRASEANTALPLAVGQPVTVIAATSERIKGFVLPAQAIVRNAANEPVVFIKSGAERFIPQPVRFRALDAETVVVTDGLGADNRVVVQGAPLIAQVR
jgi:cobalt-zinc-cadmium efflux system membrane fusion protein